MAEGLSINDEPNGLLARGFARLLIEVVLYYVTVTPPRLVWGSFKCQTHFFHFRAQLETELPPA